MVEIKLKDGTKIVKEGGLWFFCRKEMNQAGIPLTTWHRVRQLDPYLETELAEKIING